MTHLLRMFCFFFLSLSLLSCSADPEKQKLEHYNKALEYTKQDNGNAAIIELRNAIKIDPKYADARYQLGLLFLNKQEPKAAFFELQRAASLDPSNLDASVKVAEFYLLAKNNEEARKYIEKVLKRSPHNVDGLALSANLELIEGNYENAHAALAQITGEDTETDRIYNIKGRLFAAESKFTQSEKMFEKAIELGPEKVSNYRSLLLFYQNQKKSDKIPLLFAKLDSSLKDSPQTYLLKASYYRSTSEFDMAEDALRQVINLEPESEQYRLLLVSFLKQTHQYSKAEEELVIALEVLPESQDIKAALADSKFDLKNFVEAEVLVDEILEKNKSHRLATLVHGKILLNGGKTREAIETFSGLIENYPKWAEPNFYLALAHLNLGEVELAIQANEKSLLLAPANSRYHALKSQLALLQDDPDTAGKEASIALRLDPKNYPAAKPLVKALLQKKEFDKTINLIENLQKQVPADVELLSSLGLAYLGKKDKDKTLLIFNDLLAKQPANSKALAMVAILTANGDTHAAIETVKNHIAITPDVFGHQMLLGKLLLRAKKPEDAIVVFAQAQKLAPENPQPYIIRGRVMHTLGRTDEAIKEFTELVQKQPNFIPASLGLATLLESQNKLDEAKPLYTRVLELKPDQPIAANNLAYITASEEGGDLGEALRLAMLAKQAQPDNPDIADTLGLIHLKRGSYRLALSQFSQALSENPEHPTINFHAALAYYGNQEKGLAIAALDKALQAESDFGERGEAEKLIEQWKKE